jgi:hypothetical protein
MHGRTVLGGIQIERAAAFRGVEVGNGREVVEIDEVLRGDGQIEAQVLADHLHLLLTGALAEHQLGGIARQGGEQQEHHRDDAQEHCEAVEEFGEQLGVGNGDGEGREVGKQRRVRTVRGEPIRMMRLQMPGSELVGEPQPDTTSPLNHGAIVGGRLHEFGANMQSTR